VLAWASVSVLALNLCLSARFRDRRGHYRSAWDWGSESVQVLEWELGSVLA
jgi:hypothetical protein